MSPMWDTSKKRCFWYLWLLAVAFFVCLLAFGCAGMPTAEEMEQIKSQAQANQTTNAAIVPMWDWLRIWPFTGDLCFVKYTKVSVYYSSELRSPALDGGKAQDRKGAFRQKCR